MMYGVQQHCQHLQSHGSYCLAFFRLVFQNEVPVLVLVLVIGCSLRFLRFS